MFGSPIFRRYVIKLNYTDETISVYENNATSPIIPDSLWPKAEENLSFAQNLTVDMYQLYYGKMSIGALDNLQNNSAVLFDTTSQLSTVPAVNCTGCPGNWFNLSLDANASYSDSSSSMTYG
jgi:hypothetical protein